MEDGVPPPGRDVPGGVPMAVGRTVAVGGEEVSSDPERKRLQPVSKSRASVHKAQRQYVALDIILPSFSSCATAVRVSTAHLYYSIKGSVVLYHIERR